MTCVLWVRTEPKRQFFRLLFSQIAICENLQSTSFNHWSNNMPNTRMSKRYLKWCSKTSLFDNSCWQVIVSPLKVLRQNFVFLYEQPWIWPWVKSIHNELDNIFHVSASQFSCLVMNLWHHRQLAMMSSKELKQGEWDTDPVWTIRLFVVRYGFIMSREKLDICTVVANCLYVH